MPSQLRSLLGTIRRKPTQASDGRPVEASSGLKTNEVINVVYHLLGLYADDQLEYIEDGNYQ